MPQTRSRVFDDIAQLMTDAAGVAHGLRREAETLARTQIERLLSRMDLVTREEFEAVRDMAALAREENEALRRRIEALDARLAAGGEPTPPMTSGEPPPHSRTDPGP